MKQRRVTLAFGALAGLSIFGASGASAQGLQLFADMVGGNETAAADTNGYGAAAVTFPAGNNICLATVVTNLDPPTAMHIHRGVPGVAGPIVIPFTRPATGNPGGSNQCRAITAALKAEILQQPNKFYVNVHTGPFPGGAIRGQLF